MTTATDAAKARIDELVEELSAHAWRYHVLDQPTIDDGQYDALYGELERLEAEHPGLVRADSPTQRVGGRVSSDFESIVHRTPMLSLANARTIDDLEAWERRNLRMLGEEDGATAADAGVTYVTEPKIDGLAMSLTYERGEFVRAVTRGDGVVGEDVTHNVRTIRSVPMRLRLEPGANAPELVEVRGEVYLSRQGFARLNDQRLDEGLPVFMNPRNAAAGTIRQLDPSLAASRPLGFFAYSVANRSDDLALASHAADMQWLAEVGFRPSPDHHLHGSIGEVFGRCEEWEAQRARLDYDIDGVVIKVDDVQLQEELGTVGRDPRWAIAFKFAPTTATTKLRAIKRAVGRTGSITPFAVLEPVVVGGVTVSLANLHNAYDIQRKDIREGDTVIVQRAGDVIPQVVGPVVDARDGSEVEYVVPTECPSCGTPVQYEADEAILRCPNPACPERNLRLIEHFAGRTAMDIDGLGEKAVRRFAEVPDERRSGRMLLERIPDIFRIRATDISGLKGYGEKSAERLERSIDVARSQTLDRLLFGLGIRFVGERNAVDLARRFRSMDVLLAASIEDLEATPGIGSVIAASVYAWAQEPETRRIVDELRELGVALELPEGTADSGPASEGPLLGQSWVITGTLPSLSRDEAKALIEAAAGRVVGSVSKSTSVLLAGEKAGSKLNRAEALGVEVVDEAELRRRIAGE